MYINQVFSCRVVRGIQLQCDGLVMNALLGYFKVFVLTILLESILDY